MLFSSGAGSSGKGRPSYVVRLPFILSPGQTLNLSEGSSFAVAGRSCEVTKEETGHYILTCRAFATNEEALNFLAKVSAALIWFGLAHSLGLKFDPNPTPVKLYEQPTKLANAGINAPLIKKGWSELDGDYDSDKTTIIPDDKRLRVWATGSIGIRKTTLVSTLRDSLKDGLSGRNPELVLRDKKLWLACEVYLSSHFERSPRASFLSRITTLEILVEDEALSSPVHAVAERFVEEAKVEESKAKADLSKIIGSGSRADDAAVGEKRQVLADFQSLVSRLRGLRTRSIKSGIRSLVKRTLTEELGGEAAGQIAAEVSKLYDLRSNLVHSGEAEDSDVTKADSRLSDAVPRILKVLFQETSRAK